MDPVTLASFWDELTKIAGNAALPSLSSSPIGKPPSVTTPPKPTSSSGALKPNTKPTNYTVVHNHTPMAATGTADGSKSVAPPPVRA